MSHHISPLTGEVVQTGQTLELRSPVFTMDGLTAEELAREYEKDCTLEFDGQVIGWSHYAGMVRFVKRIEELVVLLDGKMSKSTLYSLP